MKNILAASLPLLGNARLLLRHLVAPGVLRLALGRPATPAERRQFSPRFAQDANMPPLLWGLLGLPEGQAALLRSAEIAWHRARAEQRGRPFGGFSELDGNIFAAWNGRPLGFLHVEKCGGSALLAWLARHFHPDQIDFDPHRDLPTHLCSRPDALSGAAAHPLIWGHYDLPALRRGGAGRAIFTLLREPRARLLSLYDYWRSVDPARIDPTISFAVGCAHRLSLNEFLEHDDPCLTDTIDNVYVRRLTGWYATGATRDPVQAAPEAALRRAIEALEGLFYVGITERLDRSAEGLARRLGIAPPARPLRGNVTAENHRDPSGWFRKINRSGHGAAQTALDRRTALDRELYAAALRGFSADGP